MYVSTGTADHSKAEEIKAKIILSMRCDGCDDAQPASKVSINLILDDYARYKMGKSSADRLAYSLMHLLEFFGDKKVSAINAETISCYCDTTLRKSGTLKRELTDLRSAVNHAIHMNRLQNFSFPRIPIKDEKRQKYLERSEVALLLQEAGKEYRSRFTLRLFIIIAYYSGARKSAIMGLKWDQVDFKLKMLDFFDPELDTGNKRRSRIPMSPKLHDFLLRRYRKYGKKSLYVFHQENAPNLRVKHIDKGFRSAVKRAGLVEVTPHTLRHTRVSEFAQAGEPIINISKYMAMSTQTIMSVYAHYNHDQIKDMANRIGRSQKVRTK